jgi:hypothetical protein
MLKNVVFILRLAGRCSVWVCLPPCHLVLLFFSSVVYTYSSVICVYVVFLCSFYYCLINLFVPVGLILLRAVLCPWLVAVEMKSTSQVSE